MTPRLDPEGAWVGGRLYLNEFGEEIFVPLGSSRAKIGINYPLTFVGDAMRNTRAWGVGTLITNPVEGTELVHEEV